MARDGDESIVEKVPLNTQKDNDSPTKKQNLSQQKAEGATINMAPPDSGVLHTYAEQYPVINYKRADNEVVLQGMSNSNCYIIFGSDRPSTDKSGWGAKGSNRANTIDMVVGRMAGARKGKGAKDGSTVNSSWSADAARIYISQLTDLDTNFGLVEGNWEYAGPRSGIGMKADQIRIVGRESIKLVTGKCVNCKGFGMRGEPNSLGAKLPPAGPIELIAGNNCARRWVIEFPIGSLVPKFHFIDRLQPLVLGKNLREALSELHAMIEKIWAALYQFALAQRRLNDMVSSTTWPVDTIGHAIMGSLMSLMQTIFTTMPMYHTRTSGNVWASNYLNPSGQKYICSRNVRTT